MSKKRSPQLLIDPGASTGSAPEIVGRTFGVSRFSGMIPIFLAGPQYRLIGSYRLVLIRCLSGQRKTRKGPLQFL
ncbi:MAG: hypothetical protein VXW45_04015 [Pseudomonadota bacterium]|nr:hypothetical protein [Pseudomonadota bacterium]